jgi:hypothetical protein
LKGGITMENYVCINGTKTKLTDEQIQMLGLSPDGRSISEVAEIVREGRAHECLNIHDTIFCAGYDLEIIGINHDKDYIHHDKPTITLMAKQLLPEREMHGGACENGWVNTDLRNWLNGDFINQLPEELTRCICETMKITHNAEGKAIKTADKLFIPSESELFGSAIWSDHEDGPRYEAFATCKDRKRFDDDGDSDWYWTRSTAGSASNFCPVGYGGYPVYASAATALGVPLCFCIS